MKMTLVLPNRIVTDKKDLFYFSLNKYPFCCFVYFILLKFPFFPLTGTSATKDLAGQTAICVANYGRCVCIQLYLQMLICLFCMFTLEKGDVFD